jgi:hypothetical protein
VKGQEERDRKNRLLGPIVQTVTGGVNWNCSHEEQREVSNCGRIIPVNCCQMQNLFVEKSQYATAG